MMACTSVWGVSRCLVLVPEFAVAFIISILLFLLSCATWKTTVPPLLPNLLAIVKGRLINNKLNYRMCFTIHHTFDMPTTTWLISMVKSFPSRSR
ncbi:hypothetical protein GGR58DRAFT_469990 [Xylaria digitata]|nr:hypothetical protein GGR58DRAFT_469990 [Xylaria digitata]